MKTLKLVFLLIITLVASSRAQQARFFRISGPAATKITAFRPDGSLVWTNALPGTNYTVQTVAKLPGGANWVDYVQLPATQKSHTNKIWDFNPPAGMVYIPAGSFKMGDPLDGMEMPTNIYISGFWMDTNLVSYGLWQPVYASATNHGYRFDYGGAGKASNHPVYRVDWYDCVTWCNARSKQAGLTPVYYSDAGHTLPYTNSLGNDIYPDWTANGYRMPTEAEWEKAARGGLSGHRFPWGDTICETQANYYSSWSGGVHVYPYDVSSYSGYNTNFNTGAQPYTSPVGFFPPNGYGLYDMAGNMWEWCWDWWGTPYGQPTTTNPTGPATGSERVLRGGAWLWDPVFARTAYRLTGYSPGSAANYFGFRCVRGN
jgi:formylglycine-generating enzyme